MGGRGPRPNSSPQRPAPRSSSRAGTGRPTVPGCHRRRHRCARGSGPPCRHPAHPRHRLLAVVGHGDPRRARPALARRPHPREALAHRSPGARRSPARRSRQRPIDHLHELRPHIDLGRSWSNERWDATVPSAQRSTRAGSSGVWHPEISTVTPSPGTSARTCCTCASTPACSHAPPPWPPTAENSGSGPRARWPASPREATLHQSHVDPTGLEPAPDDLGVHRSPARRRSRRVVRGPGRGDPARATCSTPTSGPVERHLRPHQPYADWLTAYGDETFAASSAAAERIADAAARAASPATRREMATRTTIHGAGAGVLRRAPETRVRCPGGLAHET